MGGQQPILDAGPLGFPVGFSWEETFLPARVGDHLKRSPVLSALPQDRRVFPPPVPSYLGRGLESRADGPFWPSFRSELFVKRLIEVTA